MVISIIAIVLQITLIVIVFSLPFRFREQQDYLDQRFKEMEEKLDVLQAVLTESAAAPDHTPLKPAEQPEANQ
ncbi:MAG: hypothetical protein UDG94_09310 [Peptococcaceae bacterium]|nr:hypothetical protein [Peptococcaceae bacterium]